METAVVLVILLILVTLLSSEQSLWWLIVIVNLTASGINWGTKLWEASRLAKLN